MATYVWDPETRGLVRLERRPPEAKVHLQTDAGFEGLQATDGTDISSRSKWNEYTHRNGLTLMNDFQGEWAQKQKQRDAIARGEGLDRERRRETIARILNEVPARDIKAIGERSRERHRQFGKDSINFKGD